MQTRVAAHQIDVCSAFGVVNKAHPLGCGRSGGAHLNRSPRQSCQIGLHGINHSINPQHRAPSASSSPSSCLPSSAQTNPVAMTEAAVMSQSSSSYRTAVVYVPPRRAHPLSTGGHPIMSASSLVALEKRYPSASGRAQLCSAGARSAFTAVPPRASHHTANIAATRPPSWRPSSSAAWPQAAASPPPPQQQQPLTMPKLTSIQQSYAKLFARNELLKLLVTKQLKQLYAQQHQAGEHSFDSRAHSDVELAKLLKTPPPSKPPPAPQPSIGCRNRNVTVTVMQPTTTTTSSAVANKQPAHTSQRLLELSTVIKAINARATSAALTTTTTRTTPPTDDFASIGDKVTMTHLATSVDLSQRCRRSPTTKTTTASSLSTVFPPNGGRAKTSPPPPPGEMVFVCEWSNCNRTFATTEQWSIHVTHTHVIASAEDGLYYCQWHQCPRAPNGFNARYKMLIHVRSHTNDKPYRCAHCAKAFLRSETLRIHRRIHSSEKLFACKFLGCAKRYTDPSSLRKHVKTKNHIVIEV